MLLYKDLITGDEMLSDSYDVKEDGLFLEVEGKWVVLQDAEVDIGGNPSAEGEDADEAVESTQRRVVDIVDAFRLQETQYDKKAYMAYVKEFMKAVAEKLPADKAEAFKAGAPDAVKKLLGRFTELQFFLGESFDMSGSMAYAYYKEGSSEPTFLFFKDALKEVKC